MYHLNSKFLTNPLPHHSCLEGYNATIVAYGQTGSGKTYTMGTSFTIKDENENGIIQRAVDHLFRGIAERQEAAKCAGLPVPEFKVTAQFLELYNEEIIDLLSDDKTSNTNIKIHEDENGSIYTIGSTSITVKSPENTLQCLHKGALSRQTGSTNMNAQSSRSHAIFTIFIKQQRVVQVQLMETESADQQPELDLNNQQEFETLTAKFNFVDLAGSERLKRTGATGDRAKEGISINSGLLSLGNVISALGDKNKRALHVPYRDSKLTRLLQDSLGGNSRTLMIACISPSDRDFIETLGTLRYANRAKNIRNKVVANQDKSSQTISMLRKQNEQLELELQEYRQGKRIVNEDGTVQINDMYHENNLLQTEINNLKTRIKVLQDTNDRLVAKNTELLAERDLNKWIQADESNRDIAEMVKGYITEIEELRTRLIEMEETRSQLRKQVNKNNNTLSVINYSMSINENFELTNTNEIDDEKNNEILEVAKSQLEHLKKLSSAYKKKKKHQEITAGDEAENINPYENSSNSNEDEISDEQEENDEMVVLHCDTDEEGDENEAPSPEQQLYSLSHEIEIKEKLIGEIEKNKRNLDVLKDKYENQVKLLTDKISQIESERDQVLSMLNQNTEKAHRQAEEARVKEKYEKDTRDLKEKLRKVQSMLKSHNARDQKNFEQKINTLRHEVTEMKKQKVKLVQKLKEETQKHRQLDLKNTKKIIQLTKQERVKDIKIKNLETERNRIKSQLKRKDEEMTRLKKSVKPLSDRAAGRANSKVDKFNSTFTFNQTVEQSLYRSQAAGTSYLPTKKAKEKWRDLESNISKLVMQKQNIIKEESKMESILSQRDELYLQLESTNKKLENALRNNQSDSYINELHEEIDGYHDNIKFLNQQLNECQSVILMIEEQKEEIEHLDLSKFICKSTFDEVYYVFEKLFLFGINIATTAAQKHQQSRNLELKCKQLEDSKVIEHNLLTQMLDTTFLGDMDIGVPSQNELNLELMNDGAGDRVLNSTYIGLDSKESNCAKSAERPTIQAASYNAFGSSAAPSTIPHSNGVFKMPLPPLTPPLHQAPKFAEFVRDEMEGETNHLAKVEEHIANLEKQHKLSQQFGTNSTSTSSLNYPYESKELRKEDYNRARSRFTSSDPVSSSDASTQLAAQSYGTLKQDLPPPHGRPTNSHHLSANHVDETMSQSMISSNSHLKAGNGEIKRAPSAPSLK